MRTDDDSLTRRPLVKPSIASALNTGCSVLHEIPATRSLAQAPPRDTHLDRASDFFKLAGKRTYRSSTKPMTGKLREILAMHINHDFLNQIAAYFRV